MRKLFFPLVAVLFLTTGMTCAENPERALAVACQGYASTLTSLAVAKARGQLSEAQIATVDQARPGLNAICLDGEWTNPVEARTAVEAAMWQLILVQKEVQ